MYDRIMMNILSPGKNVSSNIGERKRTITQSHNVLLPTLQKQLRPHLSVGRLLRCQRGRLVIQRLKWG